MWEGCGKGGKGVWEGCGRGYLSRRLKRRRLLRLRLWRLLRLRLWRLLGRLVDEGLPTRAGNDES